MLGNFRQIHDKIEMIGHYSNIFSEILKLSDRAETPTIKKMRYLQYKSLDLSNILPVRFPNQASFTYRKTRPSDIIQRR